MFKGIFFGREFLFVSALFALTLLCSCTDDSENQKVLLDALNESIENSSIMFNKSTEATYQAIEDKLLDPVTKAKAQVWHPKASEIIDLTKSIFRNIENEKRSIKKGEVFTKTKAIELYKRLKKYKSEILKIDPKIAKIFDSAFMLITPQFDSKEDNAELFATTFFDYQGSEYPLSVLTMLQNNILILENKLVTFCNEESFAFALVHDWINPIVVQSSSIVQPGEKIEITAGIGYFSDKNKPEILINGRKTPLNKSGLAITTVRASKQPGKHFVPVRVFCFDAEGMELGIEKTIEYTVVQPVNR